MAKRKTSMQVSIERIVKAAGFNEEFDAAVNGNGEFDMLVTPHSNGFDNLQVQVRNDTGRTKYVVRLYPQDEQYKHWNDPMFEIDAQWNPIAVFMTPTGYSSIADEGFRLDTTLFKIMAKNFRVHGLDKKTRNTYTLID